MDTFLYIAGLALLLAVCLGGLLALVLGLPGTFIILGAAFVYAWLGGFAGVTWATLGWLLLLAVIGEGLEFFAAAAGAARERPSLRVTVGAIVGGLIGGLIGTPILFGVGSLLGALAGAFVGAALAVASEGGDARSALSTGFAALRGRFLGFVLKTAVAMVMIVLLFAAAS